MEVMPCVCLSIAGSDPSGGAGIQADLKTFSALGIYGAAAITSITVQNTRGVQKFVPLDATLVYDQAAAVMEDLHPDAVKIGITGNTDVILALSRLLDIYQPPFVVLDPVMVSTSGHTLIDKAAISALINDLMPCCTLVTPNLPELYTLCGTETSPELGAKYLSELTHCPNILVKGGHATDKQPTDLLYNAGGNIHYFKGQYIETTNTHGTGCTLSSAIAAYAAQGFPLLEAIGMAKDYIQQAIESATKLRIGQGHGPLNHFFSPRPMLFKEN